jgi:2-amino-4-hydroxy-6-hydroxymethyldihydropteridine diphosphokinase
MNLNLWFSWYKDILNTFGFDRDMDETSAQILSKLLEDKNGLSPMDLPIKRNVIVFGAGPSLKRNITELKNLDLGKFTIISADGATTALLEESIVPDVVVTDLDGKIDDIIHANDEGSFLAVHAHGNNIDKIEKYVPILKNILGTTQSTPLKNVYDFGGFTDGDRCLFLAVEGGANFVVLAGMDFGKIVTKYSRPDIPDSEGKADKMKEMKLEYAKKLVEWAAKNENIQIVNISQGEKVEGVEDVDVSDLEDFIV